MTQADLTPDERWLMIGMLSYLLREGLSLATLRYRVERCLDALNGEQTLYEAEKIAQGESINWGPLER